VAGLVLPLSVLVVFVVKHPEEFVFVECGNGLLSFAGRPLPQFLWCGTL
jgi:hypothetical protein